MLSFDCLRKSPDIYKIYIEELKDGRIPSKESPELIWLLLELSRPYSSHFEQWKVRDGIIMSFCGLECQRKARKRAYYVFSSTF